jgi:aminoglycoside phosphotransferase (APT) family kinase protein
MSATERRAGTGTGQRAVPDGIDWDGLNAYLTRTLPDAGSLRAATMIGGGRSNLTYRVETERRTLALRRPPLGHILPSAHDVDREYRFITALSGGPVPVPPPVAYCDDRAVLGAPFYLMDFVPGPVLMHEWPDGYGTDADRSRTCAALVSTLARLHAVDWASTPLKELARPGNYVERQLRRLGDQYDRSEPRDVPAFDEVRRRLARAVPPEQPPAIVHGDYSIHNVILAPDDPGRIVAVLDWEMATIGDPLADLGWMMAVWGKGADPAEPFPEGVHQVTALPGMWPREQLAAEYGRASDRSMEHMDFYYVLGLFKLVVIWQGIDARFRAGVTRGEGFDQYAAQVPLGAERALAAAEASSIPALRGVR